MYILKEGRLLVLQQDEIRCRASRIKLIVLDVDGVMTDARVCVNTQGVESKSFNIRDGFGMHMALHAGLKLGIITGVMSPIVEYRAKYFGITEVHQGFTDKDEVLKGIIARCGLEASQAAYIGDDLFDLPALRVAGLSAAPADAHPEVLKRVNWVSSCPGGQGAIRELMELILKSSGLWEEMMLKYAGV